jgi:hypothetical protein
MIPPLDPFALSFDSIELDPTRAPTKDAIERALAICAPPDEVLAATAAAPDLETPGFFLRDDAGGRFVVDRDFGVVSLKDETLLLRERGAVYPVRLRVVEPSGASYELDLKLRLTGRVPQVLGAEEFGFIADIAAAPLPGMSTPVRRVTWSDFAAVLGAQAKPALATQGRFGAVLAADLPPVGVNGATLALGERVPAPATAAAAWSL